MSSSPIGKEELWQGAAVVVDERILVAVPAGRHERTAVQAGSRSHGARRGRHAVQVHVFFERLTLTCHLSVRVHRPQHSDES